MKQTNKQIRVGSNWKVYSMVKEYHQEHSQILLKAQQSVFTLLSLSPISMYRNCVSETNCVMIQNNQDPIYTLKIIAVSVKYFKR